MLVPAVDRAEHALPLPRFVSLRLAPRDAACWLWHCRDDPLPPLADWLELSVPEGVPSLPPTRHCGGDSFFCVRRAAWGRRSGCGTAWSAWCRMPIWRGPDWR